MSFSFNNWFPNLVFGTLRPDTINGTDRRDIIITFGGNDTIAAGDGNDIVDAGAGDDAIEGGEGDDIVNGGRGFDTAIYAGSIEDFDITPHGRWSSLVTVRDLSNGDTDRLTGIEALYFGADDYTFYLDGRNNAVLARDDIFSTDENAALVLATADLTANDSEFDGDALTLSDVSATSALGAVVTLENGTVRYEQGSLFDSLRAGESVTDTFTYTVSDGRGGTDTATVTVTINGVNDDPDIVSAAAASVEENSDEPVLTVDAEDVDSDNVTFSIFGGADASLFTIDPATGALRFINSPDFENPADAGGDNVYDVTVAALNEHGGQSTQEIAVTVTDVDETSPSAPRINEVHYDNAGVDQNEFVEIRVAKGTDVSGMQIDLYNGSNGEVYSLTPVGILPKTSDDDFDYYVWSRRTDGIQNGSPDGIALSNNGTVIEFLSYEGTLTATDGPAAGQTSVDIGASETSSTALGQSLQRIGDGPTDWEGPSEATPGAANGGGTDPGDPTELLISEIQGTGSASFFEGTYVLVSAVVTYTVDNGFFLQEEATDADGNVLTSEGIFVFTGGAPSVSAGDLVDVAGTVDEFFGLTQITDLVSINTISSGHALPDLTDVTLPLATADALERFEGMRISLTSSTANPITVVENFNLDRYGEITVSAGDQYQPTQLYDPDTEAAEIAALTQANALNRLIIDDGVSRQNPDSFRYVPASVGDNGNGYLDAGDVFSSGGPTLRLGADMSALIEGVLSFGFDAYRMHVDGVLPVDQATNTRPAETPADVGGDLKAASFNLLNLFTTLRDGSGAGSGPNDLEPRGAATAADLARQLDKAVAAILAIDADVLGLQELENNGFGDASAIKTLVDALNAALGDDVYAFVDPTGGSPDGFIGTDAITTGVIYKKDVLSVVGSDFLEYDTGGGQQLHRPTIAVAFEEIGTGERFTLAVNHFKSKGDSGLTDPNDPNFDQGDGQSYWNAARVDAAEQLTAWLATDPTGSGDTDALIIGDLNSYAQEDPVDVIRGAGFIDLIDQFIGQDEAYSYVFSGQRGTLDQGLATSSMAGQVTGVTEWHINSDEPDLLSYSSEFTDAAFYNDDPFATSDHDPLIIGFDLGVVPVV